MKKGICVLLTVVAVLSVVGMLSSGNDGDLILVHADADRPVFTFYSAATATTPQLALWSAIRDDSLKSFFGLRVRLWKDGEALNTMMLAGEGDLWLGHVEGFWRARSHGAPVSLLAVTGWKKFYIVSREGTRKSLEDYAGTVLPYTPKGSPGVTLMKALMGPEATRVSFLPVHTHQLASLLERHVYSSALVPEPLCTLLLEKVKGLRAVLSIEEEYGRRFGKDMRAPIAGIAVNSHTAARYPGQIEALLALLLEHGNRLAKDPSLAVAAFPEVFHQYISPEIVEESLGRDPVLVVAASELREEIRDYLSIVASDALAGFDQDGAFLWITDKQKSSLTISRTALHKSTRADLGCTQAR